MLIQRLQAGDSAGFPRLTDYPGNSFLFSKIFGTLQRRKTSLAIIRQQKKTGQKENNVTDSCYRSQRRDRNKNQ